MCAVLLFGTLRIARLPGAWPSSLAGMLPLLVRLLVLERVRRRRIRSGGELKRLRKWRAAPVGAAVLLAAAFLPSSTDAPSISVSQGSSRSAAVLLESAIAVCADLLGS